MRNASRTIGSYTFLMAISGVMAFGMAMIGPVQAPSYQVIPPVRDYIGLGEDGQRDFFADPLASLPSHTTGYPNPGTVKDGLDESYEPDREGRSEIVPRRRAVVEIP